MIMTYLAVPIKVTNIDQAKKAVVKAVAAGAEMIELRLDYGENIQNREVEIIIGLVKQTGLPCIVTCRPDWEGGGYKGGEDERKDLLKHSLTVGTDYVDVELKAWQGGWGGFDKDKVILSNHDFAKLPDDFDKRLEKISLGKTGIGKIAYRAERISDIFPALDELHRGSSGMIALAMGEVGVATRLLAKKLGGFLTFASLEEGEDSAPGQVTIREMKETYLWDAINAGTKVYGVIGCPVGHSLSPLIHNRAFKETGYNGLYMPLLVDGMEQEFCLFMEGVIKRKWLDFRGLSVTIPHKKYALRFVKEKGGGVEPLAEKIGAVNTLLIDEEGKVSGYNTDYAGAIDAITETMGIVKEDLKGVYVAILGAGGVARALAAALTDVGAKVTIYNRTVEKARRLAEQFECEWAGREGLQSLDVKLVINCTSIGMFPKVDASPIEGKYLKKDMVVFDTVYNPMETKLLRESREVGAATVDGVSMFVNQAALQFEMFTGIKAPKEVMRQIIRGEK